MITHLMWPLISGRSVEIWLLSNLPPPCSSSPSAASKCHWASRGPQCAEDIANFQNWHQKSETFFLWKPDWNSVKAFSWVNILFWTWSSSCSVSKQTPKNVTMEEPAFHSLCLIITAVFPPYGTWTEKILIKVKLGRPWSLKKKKKKAQRAAPCIWHEIA